MSLLFLEMRRSITLHRSQSRILFDRMRQNGILDYLISAIKTIFSTAKMKLNNTDTHININQGVRQGSILSPLLLNIYIERHWTMLGLSKH
jgi:retron-type reverse transcriptase